MIAKSDNELHNVCRGDYLSCKSCGHIIWVAPIVGPNRFYFSSIDNAYTRHLKKCFGLKRLILSDRIEPSYEIPASQDHRSDPTNAELPEPDLS